MLAVCAQLAGIPVTQDQLFTVSDLLSYNLRISKGLKLLHINYADAGNEMRHYIKLSGLWSPLYIVTSQKLTKPAIKTFINSLLYQWLFNSGKLKR